MSEDIKPILDRWPLSEDHNVRKIIGDDGVERMQIRVCIDTYHGILQFDCDGRPDGQRPHGCEFALHYFEQLLRRSSRAGAQFHLDEHDCMELFEESHLIYQRYVLLLQVGDYPRVIRDTKRNMRLFRFVHQHAIRDEDRNRLDRWWPYILRIHYTAAALQALARLDFAAAIGAVTAARERIEQLEEMDDEAFQVERKRSFTALDELAKQIEAERPLTEIERLEREKQEAVAAEDYRLAAKLRDRIDALRRERRPGRSGENAGQ